MSEAETPETRDQWITRVLGLFTSESLAAGLYDTLHTNNDLQSEIERLAIRCSECVGMKQRDALTAENERLHRHIDDAWAESRVLRKRLEAADALYASADKYRKTHSCPPENRIGGGDCRDESRLDAALATYREGER